MRATGWALERSDRSSSSSVATVAGHIAWAAALVVAALGGPYGAVTAIAQTAAAIATISLGLALVRANAHPIGEAVVVGRHGAAPADTRCVARGRRTLDGDRPVAGRRGPTR